MQFHHQYICWCHLYTRWSYLCTDNRCAHNTYSVHMKLDMLVSKNVVAPSKVLLVNLVLRQRAVQRGQNLSCNFTLMIRAGDEELRLVTNHFLSRDISSHENITFSRKASWTLNPKTITFENCNPLTGVSSALVGKLNFVINLLWVARKVRLKFKWKALKYISLTKTPRSVLRCLNFSGIWLELPAASPSPVILVTDLML